MILYSYEFNKLPGFSKLFCDFINHNHFFDERFPGNTKIFEDGSYFKTITGKYKNRKQIKSIIENSTHSIELNMSQKQNLELLTNEKTLAIVTGQQVGFLGGPLYTLIKISTAINLAEKLNKIFTGFRFVPVFWIEDNDHDNLEASHATVYNADYDLRHLSCMEGISKQDRTCISERKLDKSILKTLDELSLILPDEKFKQEIIEKIKGKYKPDKNWNDAFIKLLNSWFGDKGLLFIKASEARKSGLFKELILKELENVGQTQQIIQEVNGKIENNGYHIQAKSFEINVFLHESNQRYKIVKSKDDNNKFECGSNLFSIEELRKIADNEPHLFSPAVLLRPVFQDYILPTASYIGGPSEIGYSGQIKELYEYFDVPMPAFLPRHSATLIDNHMLRFLEKQKLEPNYFTRKFNEIEKSLKNILFDKEIEKVFEKAREQIKDNYEEIMTVTSKIDATLIRTGASACHKSLANLVWLEKKINSAQKRVNQIIYDKYKQASNYFFPEGTMQERMYSAINYMNVMGEEQFLKLIDDLTKEEANKHYYLKMGN
ncbi:MAG: bacillithiol biosynthesis cysteine-adding enzyme BshC [Ignavibacteria bacterium GWB2_35_12]|nr:MAG: bacillithiol biosynthesis cysteine-adding enzyme BshC [Ignavibacteria bacterium GWA2_35_8]OGU38247.1 MAG: bacillithiol biosynthesis cysteine-adding enzyme BshC [Ignavibacteria bacterium GWB2_35_12]OGU95468.1 MAG: bacillithiol biosynthesis cysteine-adding enzyme BshC [Ignavibacteria bacterium RIFOXYA2_FULL_35_10]OGV20816.1 MAG: bacillithiol biosynthesis cysteine-adding enzyme BshC [Ignavibacteria bacterium RIFOXYC2_FULL_35_21]